MRVATCVLIACVLTRPQPHRKHTLLGQGTSGSSGSAPVDPAKTSATLRQPVLCYSRSSKPLSITSPPQPCHPRQSQPEHIGWRPRSRRTAAARCTAAARRSRVSTDESSLHHHRTRTASHPPASSQRAFASCSLTIYFQHCPKLTPPTPPCSSQTNRPPAAPAATRTARSATAPICSTAPICAPDERRMVPN